MQRTLIDLKVAASILGVDPSTVWRWTRRGILQNLAPAGVKAVILDRAEILELAAQRAEQKAS